MKKAVKNSNGSEKLPRAKDFKLPKRLTMMDTDDFQVIRKVMPNFQITAAVDFFEY